MLLSAAMILYLTKKKATMKVGIKRKYVLAILLALGAISQLLYAQQDSGFEKAWNKYAKTYKAEQGRYFTVDWSPKAAQLYLIYYGKDAKPERVAALKEGYALFGKRAASHSSYPAWEEPIKELLRNRAVLAEFLASNDEADLIADKLEIYANAFPNTSRSTRDLLASGATLAASKNELKISSIILVSDMGSSGHQNGAVDAGETIEISIGLKNTGQRDWRSTSAFLISDDPYVEIDSSEVVYFERDERSGETRSFTPGMEIRPRGAVYRLNILSSCPDGTKLALRLRIWDSDLGGEHDEYRVNIRTFLSSGRSGPRPRSF